MSTRALPPTASKHLGRVSVKRVPGDGSRLAEEAEKPRALDRLAHPVGSSPTPTTCLASWKTVPRSTSDRRSGNHRGCPCLFVGRREARSGSPRRRRARRDDHDLDRPRAEDQYRPSTTRASTSPGPGSRGAATRSPAHRTAISPGVPSRQPLTRGGPRRPFGPGLGPSITAFERSLEVRVTRWVPGAVALQAKAESPTMSTCRSG